MPTLIVFLYTIPMKLDITIHKGRSDRPVVIFIHGLGMDKYFWTDPANTKVFGKNIPMKVFAAKKTGTNSFSKKQNDNCR